MLLNPVIPFEPIATTVLPQGDNWIAQIKWDGVRMLTYYDGRSVRLINRRLRERTDQYPEFSDIARFCKASSVILDGEMIAFDSSRPSFHEIMKRDALQKKQAISRAVKEIPVTYMVFDILLLNGVDMTAKPLLERQQILKTIISPQPDVQVVQNFPDAAGLYEVMKQHRMEGIVCKDLTSTYLIKGKDKRWQKKKIYLDLYAAVGGVTKRDGVVNALLLGLFRDDGQLVYIGHAGGGKLSNQEWIQLTKRLDPLIIAKSPFAHQPERSKGAIWVKPKVVVKVQFLEWTPGYTMRQPSIQTLADLPVEECTFAQQK